jgi:uncharacterized protein
VFLNLKDLDLRNIDFSVAVPPDKNDYLDQRLRQRGDLTAKGVAELLNESLEEIRVCGSLRVALEGECDRCLEPIDFTVDTEFDVCYRPARFASSELDEVEIAKAESDIAFYEGDGIELNDVLREQVVLSLPMQRLCRPDCRGICPVCGHDRNKAECGCQVKPVDDRWAALKQL